MSKVAIITARGGSKRIPRKNIRPFLGRPIIAYSIDAALNSGLFDRVIVSTDDVEIAAVARKHGAEIPFMRPAELADDHTGTMPVVRHALQTLQDQGETIHYACCLYPTAPFITPALLQQALSLMLERDSDYAFSVGRFSYPIQRALRQTAEGGVEPITPEHIPKRSQDLEPAYHDAGQFYWGKADAFLKGRPLFSNASVPVVLPDHRVQDIDTEADWKRAEYLYRALLEDEDS